MAIDTEKKIRQLEDEIKALKATYSVYGGAMQVYLSNSPVYDIGGHIIQTRVKFTPDHKPKGKLLVSSVRCTVDDNNYLSSYGVLDVQDGSGSVVIQLPVIGGKFSVGIVTTSTGTFTRLQ